MMRGIYLLIVILLLPAFSMEAAKKKPRNMNSVKKEKLAAEKAIRITATELSSKEKETRKTLNTLNSLNAEIEEKTLHIKQLNQEVDSIDSSIKVISDSIDTLQGELDKLLKSYAVSVKKIKSAREGNMSDLAFIFSADSFMQAYRRMRYLKQFSKWRERKSKEIEEAKSTLKEQQDRLLELQAAKSNTLTRMTLAQQQLSRQQKETSDLASALKKESASLRKVLRDKERQARELDRELDRLIAEEQARQERIRKQEEERRLAEERKKAEELRLAEQKQRTTDGKSKNKSDLAKETTKKKGSSTSKTSTVSKSKEAAAPAKSTAKSASALTNTAAADRKLSGTFESNKGRLLFPVSGKYRIVRGFGRQKHPSLPHVTTDNSGIDIEASSGATARAIFNGKVSAVFRQPGFNTIVMIRHGQYITIYANLGDISVKTGDEVKSGQSIGHIYVDPDDNNRSIMHFELRKEKAKLNPMAWVK